MSEGDKERICQQIIQTNQEHSENKRKRLEDVRDSKHFVASDKPIGDEEGKRSLWDDHEKAFLEEVTLNLIPDDEALANVKGKTVMKWDKVKKRYTLQRVDRDNKVIREKRNESGAKINDREKDSDIYKKWQERTHMSLQRSGERENAKLVAQARSSNESRKMFKDFKARHNDLNKGEDVRSSSAVFDNKGKKLKQKMLQARAEDRKANKKSFNGSKRQYSEKALNKIQKASRPTKSKIIVKGGGGSFGKGGRGGKGKFGKGGKRF